MTARMILILVFWFPPKVLDCLPLLLLWKLFKGQCVAEMVACFLKHLRANDQCLNDAIRDSWLQHFFPEGTVFDILKLENSFQRRHDFFQAYFALKLLDFISIQLYTSSLSLGSLRTTLFSTWNSAHP